MALSDLSRESLLPSFRYAPAGGPRFFGAASRFPASPVVAAPTNGGAAPLFPIQAPKEKIEMYTPALYAACTAGGIASFFLFTGGGGEEEATAGRRHLGEEAEEAVGGLLLLVRRGLVLVSGEAAEDGGGGGGAGGGPA
ncbi:unnamed protein product [Urochloa humidicola]